MQLAGCCGAVSYRDLAVEYLQASMEQVEVAYPPESVARALQGLAVGRVARAFMGGDERPDATQVLVHHFGDSLLQAL